MSVWSWVKSKFSKKEEIVTTTSIAPTKMPPVNVVEPTGGESGGGGSGGYSGGGGSSGGGGGGGTSRINPITGEGEYVLPSGIVVPATDETRGAITSGKSDFGVLTSVSTLQPSTPLPTSSQSSYTPYKTPIATDRPYTPADKLTTPDKIKLSFKQYTQPDYYKSVIATMFGAGKYSKSNYPNPIKAMNMLVPSVRDMYRGRKGDRPRSPDIPYSGTLIYDPNTKVYGVPDPYKGKTEWETIREREITARGTETIIQKGVIEDLFPVYESKIKAKADLYQSQINTGTISLATAETSLAKDIKGFETNYNIEAQELYGTRLKDDPLYGQVGRWRSDFNKASQFDTGFSNIVTTGALVAGSFVAPVATGAVIATSSFGSGYEGISEKDYKKAVIGFSVGALGVYGSSRALANQITRLQIEDVLKVKPKSAYSMRVGSRGVFTDFYASKQYTPNAYAYTKGSVITKVGKGDTFKILGGESSTQVWTRDYWTGNPLVVKGTQKILTSGGTFYPSLARGGFTPSKFDLTTSTKFDYSMMVTKRGGVSIKGSYYYGKISTDPYGGFSKNIDKKTILSFSGKTSGKIDYFQRQGFKQIAKQTYSVDVDTIGFTKIVKPQDLFKSSFSAFPSGGSYAGSFSSGGGSTGTDLLTKSVLKFQPPVITPSVSGSQIYGSTSGIINKISGGSSALLSIPKVKVETISRSKISSVNIQAPVLSSRTIQKMFAPPVSGVRGSYGQITVPFQGVSQINIPALDTQQKLVKLPALGSPLAPSMIAPNFPFKFRGLPFALPFLPSLDERGLGKKRIKVRRIVKYTPSFSALVFGIKGKKPKGVETGLRVRPITKGSKDMFKFFNPFRQPKRVVKKRIVRRKRKGGKR